MATRTPPPADVPAPAPQSDWRTDVIGASGLNILAGIWLIVSPWILDFNAGDSYWNPIIIGVIVGVLALVRAAGAFRESWLSWINVVAGAWLFVSAWWLAESSQAQWNDWIMGAVVFVLGVISATATEQGLTGPRGTRRPPQGRPLDSTY